MEEKKELNIMRRQYELFAKKRKAGQEVEYIYQEEQKELDSENE